MVSRILSGSGRTLSKVETCMFKVPVALRALVDIDPVGGFRPGVLGTRPDDTVLGALFHDVGTPTRHASADEDRREEFRGNAQLSIRRGVVKVCVGKQLLLAR